MRGQWVRVGGKRRLDLAADTGFEQRVGDGRDDLVALVAPGGGQLGTTSNAARSSEPGHNAHAMRGAVGLAPA
jgi:hypothetical protein